MRILFFLFLFIFSFRPAGYSTTIALRDLKSLMKEAESIGLFKVVKVRYITVNGKHLFTRYYLMSLLCFYGCRDGEEKVLDVPGGASGKVKARVTGAPELQVDENYVMILSRIENRNSLGIAGFNQGIFFKTYDPVKGDWFLKPFVLKKVIFNGKEVREIKYSEFLQTVKDVFGLK